MAEVVKAPYHYNYTHWDCISEGVVECGPKELYGHAGRQDGRGIPLSPITTSFLLFVL
jgi:hypothetical protein